jgi:hypothetical protein
VDTVYRCYGSSSIVFQLLHIEPEMLFGHSRVTVHARTILREMHIGFLGIAYKSVNLFLSMHACTSTSLGILTVTGSCSCTYHSYDFRASKLIRHSDDQPSSSTDSPQAAMHATFL